MKRLLTILFLTLSIPAWSQKDSVTARIILIGDAGALVNGLHPVPRAARNTIPFDGKTVVVYLGDNLYREGMPDDAVPNYEQSKAVLDSQIAIANNTNVPVYFIPGNHDWMNGQPNGFQAVLRQQRYIASLSNKNVQFVPEGGCPGPIEVPIGKDAVMVIMDSQWWLHPYDKPGVESDCDYKTKEAVLEELSDIVSKNDKKLLLFACHHPFRSTGIHGGYYGLKQHIFPFTDMKRNLYIPLPVLGSIYPIARSVFGTPQDMKHPNYANMIAEVEDVIREHPHPVFAAGHEHALEFFQDSIASFIVSGSGCKDTRVEKSRKAKYVTDSLGFAVLSVYANKTSSVQYYTVSEDGNTVNKAYFSPIADFSKLPEPEAPDTAKAMPEARFEEFVTVPASIQYQKTSGIQRFVIGNNYRKVWSTPVKMEVFKVKEEDGGLKITDKGGGMQTTSLRLEDKNKREYALRTIDKNPESVMPVGLRRTVFRAVVQDVISAANPYGALVVPDLAEALSIPHANPKLVFVPNDPALGYYRSLMANKVCLLEEREPVEADVKTRGTAKTINKILEENDHRVDQNQVLRARLLDLMIGDWDRHFDQWRFGVDDTGKGKLYYAIPRDRDQVFFNSDGALLWLATKRLLPFLKGFKYNIPKVQWLGYNARNFDRFFLNDLDGNEWKTALNSFDSAMTDDVLEKAVSKYPAEVYSMVGPMTLEKMKNRRDLLLKKDGMKFYRFLSEEVNVVGSNKSQYFHLSGDDSGVQVKVYEMKKSGDTDFVMYDRHFKNKETKELRLYGLNGDDKFQIDDNVRSKIHLRIIGGKGNDTFNVEGAAKNFIYDHRSEKNVIQEHRRSDIRISDNPSVNDYDVSGYKYNTIRLPSINASYNPEDGVMAGLGITRTTYGFRKEPYKTLHKLNTLYSFTQKAYRINYRGEFVDLLRHKDLVLNGVLHDPTLTNFFGLGNETKFDRSIDRSYYRVRYKFLTADALLRKRFYNNKVSFGVGPTFYHYWNPVKNNVDRILENPGNIGLDSLSVYAPKSYLGGKAQLVVNNLNNNLFPTRGINWVTDFTATGGISGADVKPYTAFTSDMQLYASLSDPARLVAVLHIGGGHIFSKNYEYFQAMGIGQNNYLRGFRKNRFTGNSMAYGSLELRYKLADVNSRIVPGAFGLVGFNDIGRVWVKGENSGQWHNSPGGGVYFIPFNLVILSGTVAFSQEEALVNFTVGTRLNLTF